MKKHFLGAVLKQYHIMTHCVHTIMHALFFDVTVAEILHYVTAPSYYEYDVLYCWLDFPLPGTG
jgi:hypothetical protein